MEGEIILGILMKKIIFVDIKKKKLIFCSLCPLRPRGGGLKVLTDISAKNVSWTAPLIEP